MLYLSQDMRKHLEKISLFDQKLLEFLHRCDIVFLAFFTATDSDIDKNRRMIRPFELEASVPGGDI